MFFDLFVNERNAKKTGQAWGKQTPWPEAEVWERLHMGWGYVKDHGNILVMADAGSSWIEAFPVGNRTSKTVEVHCVKSLQDLGYQEY